MKSPRIAVLAFGLTALIGTAALAGPTSDADQKYLAQAAQGSFTDAALTQAAQKQGTPAIRQFVQILSDDRDQASDQLKVLAQQKGAALPAQIAETDKQAVAQAAQKTGADFDKTFLEQELALNGDSASAAREEIRTTADPDLKKFAAQTLKTDEAHIQRACALLGLMGGSDEVGLASVARA